MTDILLNTASDLQTAGGDIATGFADQQHQQLLLVSEKGAFKQFPGVGVGLFGYIESEDAAAMLSEIRKQFNKDGLTINALNYQGAGKLDIDANY